MDRAKPFSPGSDKDSDQGLESAARSAQAGISEHLETTPLSEKESSDDPTDSQPVAATQKVLPRGWEYAIADGKKRDGSVE